VRDELFLNEGHKRFREVGAQVGLDPPPYDHSTGAVFVDVNVDGRPDLYVANDEDPNRLYLNEPGGPLGFHFVDVARQEHVADRNAGMGVAPADVNGDGRTDLLVTNSRGQTNALFSSRGSSFAATRLANEFTGWGDTWVDLQNTGSPDLVVANGGIPVTSLTKDAAPVQVLDHGAVVRLPGLPRVNGRGVAAADYDNDGRVDIAINSIGGRLILLHNTSRAGHWLEVQAPLGKTVTAVLPDGRRLFGVVRAGSSYLSSEDPRVHFGLGGATRLRELIVGSTVLHDVRADRVVAVR
jgi:hypothetical protein